MHHLVPNLHTCSRCQTSNYRKNHGNHCTLKKKRLTKIVHVVYKLFSAHKETHSHAFVTRTFENPNLFFFDRASGVLKVKNTNPLPHGFVYKIIPSHIHKSSLKPLPPFFSCKYCFKEYVFFSRIPFSAHGNRKKISISVLFLLQCESKGYVLNTVSSFSTSMQECGWM